MEKQAVDFKERTVAETLIIPLLAKAKETKSENPILSDPKAVEIMNQISVDSEKFEGGEISDFGILVRTEIIDSELKKIVDNTLKPTVIINLGVGLDTRISRMDNERLVWFDLDFPEVIKLRKKFFSEAENVSFIPKSVLDESWMEEIAAGNDDNVVFIAEGLLMYFPEPEVKEILGGISEKFKGAHMLFDVVHSYFVGKGVSCQFLWGLDKASYIEKMSENIELIQSWSTGNLHKERQSLLFRILNVFPSTRDRSQILHIRFK